MTLEGGCIVTDLRAGPPQVVDTVKIWRHVGRHVGADAITLQVLEIDAGPAPGLVTRASSDVCFVVEGRGTAFIDGHAHALAPDTGFYVHGGATLTYDVEVPLVIVSSQCPDPECVLETTDRVTSPLAPSATVPVVRLEDRDVETTGDRWYSVLVGASAGSKEVTQFIGSIPPGRAPDHLHHYEEVICVLRGCGRLWARETSAAVGVGSCIFLPRRQIHCLENTGEGELRLVGVFYPAGSPAARYDA